MPEPHLVPIEQLAPGWRTAPLSPSQLDTLRFLRDGGGNVNLRVLPTLWKLGLVVRLYRAAGTGWAPASWALSERGRIRLDEEPCVRAF